MIDTEKKIIYFGYGDVLVGSIMTTLSVTGIDKSFEVGSTILREIRIENHIAGPIKFKFTDLAEINYLKNCLKAIDGTTSVFFKYDDHIFDFSKYNTESINTILRHLKNIEQNLIFLTAC